MRFIAKSNSDLSVQPLCSVCLSGELPLFTTEAQSTQRRTEKDEKLGPPTLDSPLKIGNNTRFLRAIRQHRTR